MPPCSLFLIGNLRVLKFEDSFDASKSREDYRTSCGETIVISRAHCWIKMEGHKRWYKTLTLDTRIRQVREG